jgi:hypothetical protein
VIILSCYYYIMTVMFYYNIDSTSYVAMRTVIIIKITLITLTSGMEMPIKIIPSNIAWVILSQGAPQ